MSVPGQGEVGPDPPPPPPPPPEPDPLLPDPLVPLPTPTPLEPTPATDPLALTLQSLADRVDALEKTGSFAPGMIAWTAGPDAPPGWLIADGQAFDVNLYAALAIICPTGFLPNLVDKTIVGAGALYALLSTGGASSLTLTAAQSGMPAHMHTIAATTGSGGSGTTGSDGAGTTGSTTPGVTGASSGTTGSATPGGTVNAGGAHNHSYSFPAVIQVAAGATAGIYANAPVSQITSNAADHSHSFTGAAHTHTTPSHTHTSAAHTHTVPAHTHTVPAHTHTLPDTDNVVAQNASAPISTLSPYVALTPLIHI